MGWRGNKRLPLCVFYELILGFLHRSVGEYMTANSDDSNSIIETARIFEASPDL
jgi:hypothetical protein